MFTAHSSRIFECSAYQRIRGYFYNDMRYINLRFTYLLTYFTTLSSRCHCWSWQ